MSGLTALMDVPYFSKTEKMTLSEIKKDIKEHYYRFVFPVTELGSQIESHGERLFLIIVMTYLFYRTEDAVEIIETVKELMKGGAVCRH